MDDEEFVVPPEGDDIEKPNTIRQSFKINQSFAYGALLEPETYDEAWKCGLILVVHLIPHRVSSCRNLLTQLYNIFSAPTA